MQYLDTPKQQKAPAPAQGADKYHGAVAKGYDAKRTADPKWTIEQKIITGMLADLPRDSIILDCPVGTGRFIPFYCEKGFMVLGMDISVDMLNEASNKSEGLNPRGELRLGDCRDTKLPDQCVDATVNCRITRWLSPEDCQKMFREMQRVSKKRCIFTARVANHIHARSIELFEQALQPGWKITHNVAGYVTDYRIIMAERVA